MINLRVHSNLVLCGVTNQTFGISKGNLYFEKHVLAAAQKKKKLGYFPKINSKISKGDLTKEGVVRLPWSLAIISILSSLNTPTQE